MTHHPPYSGGPDPGRAVLPVPPGSVELAVRLIWTLIALSVATGVITFLSLDTIVEESLAEVDAGPQAAATARAAARGGVVIGLLVGVGLNTVLAVKILQGANWARITYTVVATLGVLLTALSYLTGSAFEQPGLLLLLGLVSFALTLVVLVQLWRRESNAWFAPPRAIHG